MDRLRELLDRQYKQYRQRMNYLTWYFEWETETPFERMLFRGQIR